MELADYWLADVRTRFRNRLYGSWYWFVNMRETMWRSVGDELENTVWSRVDIPFEAFKLGMLRKIEGTEVDTLKPPMDFLFETTACNQVSGFVADRSSVYRLEDCVMLQMDVYIDEALQSRMRFADAGLCWLGRVVSAAEVLIEREINGDAVFSIRHSRLLLHLEEFQ